MRRIPQGWHMTCEQSLKTATNRIGMATKMKMLKLLLEGRGLAQLTSRRPPNKHPGLFLLQLRSKSLTKAPPRRKQMISIDMQDMPEIPHPVRITHRKTAPPTLAAQVPVGQ